LFLRLELNFATSDLCDSGSTAKKAPRYADWCGAAEWTSDEHWSYAALAAGAAAPLDLSLYRDPPWLHDGRARTKSLTSMTAGASASRNVI